MAGLAHARLEDLLVVIEVQLHLAARYAVCHPVEREELRAVSGLVRGSHRSLGRVGHELLGAPVLVHEGDDELQRQWELHHFVLGVGVR